MIWVLNGELSPVCLLYLQPGSVHRNLPDDFIKLFDEANALGLQHIDEIVEETPFDLYDLEKILYASSELSAG